LDFVYNEREASSVNLRLVLHLAFGALARNRLRSALTMLGVIIGVGAVICAVAIGRGASNQIQESIRNLGDNMVWIEAGGRNVNGVRTGNSGTKSLTVEDAEAIRKNVPYIRYVSEHVDTPVQVIYGGQNWYTRVRGVSPEYFIVRRWPVDQGAAFTYADIQRAANVCLLGRTVAERIFEYADPIGQTIRVKGEPCLVIGLMARKGLSPFGNDQDDTMFMPYSTVQKKIKGNTWVDDIWCSAESYEAIAPAEKQIEALLRERHHLRPDQENDFNLRHPVDIAEARAQSQHVMTMLLAAIASIALVVGGIGIMNIMLVSVTERTREIGVRLAVGATEDDVKKQFLTEAVVLSSMGGAAGVLAGIAGSHVVSQALGWPTSVSTVTIFVALGFSAAVGIFFGFYPARKAAALDPIEALRHE
jgi:putative ABC transport system permease protein